MMVRLKFGRKESAAPESVANNMFMPPFQGFEPFFDLVQMLRRNGLQQAKLSPRFQHSVGFRQG